MTNIFLNYSPSSISRTASARIDTPAEIILSFCDGYLTRRQACYLHYRPDFDGADTCPWNPCGDADRLVEILGVDQEVAAELFARLRERTIGQQPFAVAHPDAGRRRRWVQRVGGQILPTRVKLLRELRRLPVTLLPLGFAQGLLVAVNQQHVFHVSASTSKSN